MERCRKKDILALIHTMMEANESVVKALPADPQKLNDVFIQCQDAAIQIGTQLESFGDKYTPIVNILEDYCEKVYQMSIVTSDGNACRKLAKKIRKQLTDLQNRIQYEMPEDRKEVVFLPYKASMWDSLESVWKAADADENTDAYVIPIPYYDKNPDGSFREEHYEGDLYPDYVPITKYDEYDFEGRRPDMIYIHNPYDNNNYVTSVHPFFYSGNLKKFTDKLVYIPYFVLGEIDPENADAVEGMKHFCITQGVINADKVIVQSEDMKKIYVNVLTDFMKEHTGEDTRKYWEEKILGLGSPKMDKVLSTRKEDVVVPEEWLKVIEKPDGSWKKIIFYNTSVQALLEHNEKMNRKIKDVLRVFKENQEEVALLWRPHPLIEATIKSVRVRLWEEYKEIVDTYREEGWGIYDDTADLDRAIAVSDGYYGDPSSVVQLYRETGKPVMYQNVEVLSDKEVNLNCADIVKYNDRLFILTRDTQCLFEYCCTSGKMKLCGTVKNEEGRFCISMALCQHILYIAPYEGNDICTYDIDKNEFNNIALGTSQNGLVRKHYHLCFSHQNKVYLLGGSGSAMLCLEPENNHEVREISEWVFDFKEKYNCDAAVCTHSDICIVEDCLWVAVRGNNVLLEYNMSTEKYCFWKVGKKEIQYVTITFDGDYFWLSGDKRFIVRWNKENNEVMIFDDFPQGFEYGTKEINWKELFSCGCLWNGNIYFLPLNSNMLIKFNRNSGNMNYILKIMPDHICFKMKAINKEEVYVEEIYMNILLRANSYNILSDDQYKESDLKFGINDEIDGNYMENKIGILNEDYPFQLFSFLGLKKYENDVSKH